MSARAYSEIFWWRAGNLPFTGNIVNSKVFWNGPSMDTDDKVVTGQARLA